MFENAEKSVRIHGCCVITRGYSRSIILDFQRNKYQFVSNEILDIIELSKEINICDILKNNPNDESRIEIVKYLQFLYENEYIYLYEINKEDNLQSISLTYDIPNIISNSIIDVDFVDNYWESAIDQLDKLGCQYLQLRWERITCLNQIKDVLAFVNGKRIKVLELFLPFSTLIEDNIIEICKVYLRINRVIIFNSPKNELIDLVGTTVFYSVQKNQNYNECGFVHYNYFTPGIDCFSESQKYNTCLNRKICIDINGVIKNCPSMQNSYGNIKETTLENAINMSGFKDYWTICKDDIDVCKDCEFRHMCTDCRCFIKNKEDKYSQPSKCGYNPYICKWEGENGYVTIEECGTYSEGKGFIIDLGIVNKLNNQLWEND